VVQLDRDSIAVECVDRDSQASSLWWAILRLRGKGEFVARTRG
jgi:hypothetical protein